MSYKHSPLKIVEGTCMPLNRSDVDTDQIIPSQWLKRVERTGFEKGLFSEWRDAPDFVLNDERYAGSTILITGPNFGTGSSREHAVWALQQYGFQAIVSSKFGDIFKNNCTKCGLVPVEVSEQFVNLLFQEIESDPQIQVSIDIERLTIEAGLIGAAGIKGAAGQKETFYLDPATQERFLQGLDDIDLTFQQISKIEAHEAKRPAWLN